MPSANQSPSAVTPNRRGVRSREAVLDAAERVMAEQGYEAATVARVVEVSGIPISSVYHYYGSKDGILLAVMQRGAERFFADLGVAEERLGSAEEHLTTMATLTAATLERHPDFLSLLIVFATQPTAMRDERVREVVTTVRDMARAALRHQLALAFDVPASDPAVDRLARTTLALIDGAFVASQADAGVTISGMIGEFADVLVALDRGFGSVVIQPIHGDAASSAIRIIVRAVKGGRAPLQLCASLALRDASGAPDAYIDRVVRGQAILSLAELK